MFFVKAVFILVALYLLFCLVVFVKNFKDYVSIYKEKGFKECVKSFFIMPLGWLMVYGFVFFSDYIFGGDSASEEDE